MLIDRINKNYQNLNDTDEHILKTILKDITVVEKMNIMELATLCSTSRTSILRFCKKLEFSGYSEFKNYIKWENRQNTTSTISDSKSYIKKDFESTYFQLTNTIQVKEIAKKIKEANKVFIYGTGQAQQYCARELQRLFMQINKYLYIMFAAEEFKLGINHLNSSDLVIIISLSGNIDIIEAQLNILKYKSIPIASVTNLENNKLASMSDYRLYVVSSPISLHNDIIHNSFSNFFVAIEYIFLTYLELYKPDCFSQ